MRAGRVVFFFSSRRRHTRWPRDWSSDVCSSDLYYEVGAEISRLEQSIQHMRELRERQRTDLAQAHSTLAELAAHIERSEERRVGKECRYRWSTYHLKKKTHTDGSSTERQSTKRR